jgi:quinol monooxygenase YgiN
VNTGKEEKFFELVKELAAASQAEEGCIEYILHKDVHNPLISCINVNFSVPFVL